MTVQRKVGRRAFLWSVGALVGFESARRIAGVAGRYRPASAIRPLSWLRVDPGHAVDRKVNGYRFVIDTGQWLVQAPGGSDLWRISHSPVTALSGTVEWHDRTGHFTSDQQVDAVSAGLRVRRIAVSGNTVTVAGTLTDRRHSLTSPPSEQPVKIRLVVADPDRLRVTVETAGSDAVLISLDRPPEAGVRGLGEQFASFDLDGRFVPVVTREQGVGRGRQPLTFLSEATEGAGGDPLSTYAPLPFALVGANRALALGGAEYSTWDVRQENRLDVTNWASHAQLTLYRGDTPAELVRRRTDDTGRPPIPPGWALEGAIVGLQGGSAEVRRKLAAVQDAGTVVSAVWLQDWVGRRTTSFGDRLWWTWEVDREHYPDWPDLVAELNTAGIRVLTYVNPFVVGGKPGLRRDLFAEADERGFLVRDPRGGPYRLDQGEFAAALVDLSNPKAKDWFTTVIAEQVATSGVDGWMADFGEGLPFDAVIAGGDAARWHNRWPDLWAEVNRAACERAGKDDCLVFHRSAGPATPGIAPMMWAGDQLVTFDEHDGIRSAVRGMLAAGASGIPFVHSDTGGYTGLAQPVVGVRRSAELLARWAELSAWGIVLRTHEGNRPAESVQVYSTSEQAAGFAAQSRVFAELAEYRASVAHEAARTGMPALRHGWLYDPRRTASYWDEQFFFGDSFLIAPVLADGAMTVTAHLPPGRWVHLWSGKRYVSTSDADAIDVPAPLGQPGVFFREGDVVAERLRPKLVAALRG